MDTADKPRLPTIKVITPYEGNDRWFNALERGKTQLVAVYDCRPWDDDGPLACQPHPDAVREALALHPGMDLVYLGAPYDLD